MKLNQLSDNPGARKSRIRVGRGIGSGMGKQGGRGGTKLFHPQMLADAQSAATGLLTVGALGYLLLAFSAWLGGVPGLRADGGSGLSVAGELDVYTEVVRVEFEAVLRQ